MGHKGPRNICGISWIVVPCGAGALWSRTNTPSVGCLIAYLTSFQGTSAWNPYLQVVLLVVNNKQKLNLACLELQAEVVAPLQLESATTEHITECAWNNPLLYEFDWLFKSQPTSRGKVEFYLSVEALQARGYESQTAYDKDMVNVYPDRNPCVKCMARR